MNNDIIEERIIELSGLLAIKISRLEQKYSELSEKEKIPFRIMSAEITALKDYLKGGDLDYNLAVVVDYEHYCGAEGIKRAKDYVQSVITAKLQTV